MTAVLLPAALLLIAALYASVGHGGASGYIAVMALAGLAPETIRPTALMMNVVVAGIATAQFARAGYFRWALLWPFAVAAVPFAWLGGRVPLDAGLFGLVVGAVLLLSAARLFWQPREATYQRVLSLAWALPVGALLGLISGLVGVGGGIFLTPLLLFAGWARAHVAAAVSAPFILLNSLAGLLGWWGQGQGQGWPPADLVVPLLLAAVIGGSVGGWLGSRRLPPIQIKRALAVVLLVAGLKMLGLGVSW
ncbi:sulfite exporter TauE/SafE family protein [Polycyclovorans algicola]|uniref:sulfite exporter TauE/SafE family protein n=1 Tax=Polycyclovorans algicola TaxID=616992 RepID=UPI0004A76FAF|nr:sulfite exporter TauE/SafE family protein [Polycyclovorans algicola]